MIGGKGPLFAVLLLGFAGIVQGCSSGGGGTGPVDAAEAFVPQAQTIPFITDTNGRALVLHGVNVDYGVKGNPEVLPIIPDGEPERLARDFGLNLVRLLMVWEGVEPEPWQVDQSYLDRIDERVGRFADAGMFVVLDMHQDVYARRFCCDGAPEWAIRDDGQSFTMQPQWFLNYFEAAVQRAFDNFWAYDKGAHADLQDHYAAAWAQVAKRFKDNPAVLGYDLMNEPHPGSDFDVGEALGLEPGPDSPSPRFDREELSPFYQRVVDAIRLEDPDGWIFVEPRYGAPGNGSPSWMGGLTDPRDGHPRIAYFPHLYSVQLEQNQAYLPGDTTVSDWETNRGAEIEKEGWPLLIGEWGLGPDWKGSHDFMNQVMAMADRLMAGWAYWSWDPGGWSFLDHELKEQPTADLVARVYPRRVAGRPTSWGYDPSTRKFFLEFEDREEVTGPTEIFIPAKRHYPDGWELTVSDPDGSWSMDWDGESGIAHVTTAPNPSGHRIEIGP